MKKIGLIVSVLFLLVVGLIYQNNKESNTKVIVINMSSPASPAGVFAQAVKKAVDGDWYQSSDCSQGHKAFKNLKNSVVVYNSSVAFAALNKKLENCQLAGNISVSLVAQTPMHVCRLPNTTTRLEKDTAVLGMASMYAVKKHQDQFNNQPREGAVRIIPYSGSATVLKALLAGDIDWGWIGAGLARKHSDKIICEWTTDKNDKTIKFLGDGLTGLTIPDFAINIVVYTADKKLANKITKLLENNEDFKTYVNKSAYTLNTKPTATDIEQVNKFVQRMYDTWAN